MRLNTVNISHKFILMYLRAGGFCIDATMGRGNDTKFLCQVVGSEGRVLSFDIQNDAIKSTQSLLLNSNLENATLILDGHQNMDKYAKELTVDCVVFNFGYLPKGDHSICTKAETSILAIKKAMNLIKVGGFISLCLYYGGDTGFEEKNAILDFVESIDCHFYTVFKGDFINRPNCPPIFIGIVKDRSYT